MIWDFINKGVCKMLIENFQVQVYWFFFFILEYFFIIKESYLMVNIKSYVMGCIFFKKVGVDFLEYVEIFIFVIQMVFKIFFFCLDLYMDY